jgi:GTPase SAR1 family protein
VRNHCRNRAIAVASLTLVASFSVLAIAQTNPVQTIEGATLEAKVTALDAAVFDAYNKCDLTRFGNFIALDVEFFHDDAGLMLGRPKIVEATEKHICGKVRRELVAGSLVVYPIKDYGAIATGEHRFCETATNECVGVAKFTNVWRNRGGKWEMTRILSYDHQPLKR